MLIVNRLLQIPVVRRSDALRTFILAAWLGWQVESNWAQPWQFAIYAVARPISGVLILVVMYSIITNGALQDPLFGYIYLGNALYILVSNIVGGISWSLMDDREHYRTMKQIYTAPIDGYAYLVGRGVARMIIGTISVLITLLFGVIALGLPLSLANVQWMLFIPGLIFGLAAMAGLGIILASISLQMARHGWTIGDSVTGALYLFTGAIFPLDVLPAFLRPIGFLFPVTYWLEVMRRAILPESPRFPTLAGMSDLGLLGVLALMTALLIGASVYLYRWAVHQAKEKGIIDMETNY